MVIGHTGADPELRYTPNGSSVTTFPLYCTVKAGKDSEETTLFRVTFFGPRGDAVNQYLSKGRLVMVQGRFKANKWTGNDGVERTQLEILGSEWRMLGPNPAAGQAHAEPPSEQEVEDAQEDLPF